MNGQAFDGLSIVAAQLAVHEANNFCVADQTRIPLHVQPAS
jgi:hypothetical protein